MRLICPSCSEQYEVSSDAIPVQGRNVQCSKCDHTWFQHNANPSRVISRIQESREGKVAITPPPPKEETAPEPQVAQVADTAVVEEATQVSAPRKELDAEIAKILQAEVNHEAKMRALEKVETNGSYEAEQEHGSDDTDLNMAIKDALEEAQQIRANTKENEAWQDQEATPQRHPTLGAVDAQRVVPRKHTLQVEEPAQMQVSEPAANTNPFPDLPHNVDADGARNTGFILGFFSVILIFGALVGAYIYDERINAQMPQAEPYITSYTTYVDTAITWGNDQLRTLAQRLDSFVESNMSE